MRRKYIVRKQKRTEEMRIGIFFLAGTLISYVSSQNSSIIMGILCSIGMMCSAVSFILYFKSSVLIWKNCITIKVWPVFNLFTIFSTIPGDQKEHGKLLLLAFLPAVFLAVYWMNVEKKKNDSYKRSVYIGVILLSFFVIYTNMLCVNRSFDSLPVKDHSACVNSIRRYTSKYGPYNQMDTSIEKDGKSINISFTLGDDAIVMYREGGVVQIEEHQGFWGAKYYLLSN